MHSSLFPTLLTTALCLGTTLALPSIPPAPAWLASYSSTTCSGNPREPPTHFTMEPSLPCQLFTPTTNEIGGAAARNGTSAFLFSDPDCRQQNQIGVFTFPHGGGLGCMAVPAGKEVKGVSVASEAGGVQDGMELMQGGGP